MKDLRSVGIRFSSHTERLLAQLWVAALAILSVLSLGYAGLKILRLRPNIIWGFSCFACIIALCLFYFSFRLLQRKPVALICPALLALALLPRIAFGMLAECLPVSDFTNYHQFALWLSQGDVQRVAAIAQDYQLAEFAGLAVLNYGLSLLFSPSVAGMILSSQVLSALLCPLIFLLGRQIHKPSALLAALLYAFYPGSIVSAQIITNQHGATLFALLAFLPLLQAAKEPRFLSSAAYAALGGVLLTVSHFFHPSSVVIRIAIACFFLWTILRQGRSASLRLPVALCCFFLVFHLSLHGSLLLLKSHQLLPESLHTDAALSKIAVGLNPDTNGAYSAADYHAINALPYEERNAYALQLITERVSQPAALLKTLASKTFSMWVRTDNLFLFYIQGVEAGAGEAAQQTQAALAWGDALQLWDALFLSALYACAAFCLCDGQKSQNSAVLRLLLWVLSGWAGVHLLSEIQPRYRYFAMPMLALLAGIGLWHIWQNKARMTVQIKKRFLKIKGR